MAKITLWEDNADEPENAKKRTGPRPNPLYSRDDEEDIKYDREQEARDRRFFYGDSFDDSDDRWYRKSSFRFSEKADYSPRSMFRSEFTSSWYAASDGSNETKNKAIRALRELTRSANTIVDTAMKHAGYAVQYSNGTNSNGATDVLNDEKQRVVYVSPDTIVAAKTSEDEDAAIDALTGFVMMRVQIAQSVTAEVTAQLNATGLGNIGFWLASNFMPGQPSVLGPSLDITTASDGELGAVVATATDRYLAGMLAKTFLMRAARRAVVSNWGGFAPYFVRHAKKFAHVKEELEKQAESLEVLVAKLGYNMLADETPIAVPETVEKLADKYFSAEVPPAKLLAKCISFVVDLRGKEPAATAGDVEKQLLAAMQDIQKTHKKYENAAQGIKESRDAMSDALHDMLASAAGTIPAIGSEESKMQVAASATRDADQAVKALTAMKDRMKNMEVSLAAVTGMAAEPAPTNAAEEEEKKTREQTALNALARAAAEFFHEARTNPRAAAHIAAHEDTAKPIDELLAACAKNLTTPEAQKQLGETIKKALGTELPEPDVEARREAAIKAIDGADAMVQDLAAKFDGSVKASLEAACGIIEKHDMAAFTPTAAAMVAAHRAAQEKCSTASTDLKDCRSRVERARSASGIETALEYAAVALRRLQQGFTHDATLESVTSKSRDAVRLSLTRAARVFQADHVKASEPMLKETMREAAAAAMPGASKRVTGASRAASLAQAWSPAESDELKTAERPDYKKLGHVHGTNPGALNELRKALKTNDSKSQDGESPQGADDIESAASKLGKSLAEAQKKLNPVDNEIFGDKIERRTCVLTDDSVEQVNNEARNAPEEDFVAYLHGGSSNTAKPTAVNAIERAQNGQEEARKVVAEIAAKNRGAIERVRSALSFQNHKRVGEEYGLRSGDLDEGNLHKLGYDCDHIWSKKVVAKLPDVAVAILVDQSGSMSGSKISEARALCIVLAEALRKIPGVRLYVYGHTANMSHSSRGSTDTFTVFEHYTPGSTDLTRLGCIRAHCNNYDGYAIKEVAKRLAEDPAKTKHMFVIADGFPAGAGYSGDDGQKHVKSVCKFVRDRLKIGLYAFGVGLEGQEAHFKEQYGADKTVFVTKVIKCLPQITRFLRNMLQKERKLVSVE